MHPNSCLGALYQIVVRKPYCVSRLIQSLNGCYCYFFAPNIIASYFGRCAAHCRLDRLTESVHGIPHAKLCPEMLRVAMVGCNAPRTSFLVADDDAVCQRVKAVLLTEHGEQLHRRFIRPFRHLLCRCHIGAGEAAPRCVLDTRWLAHLHPDVGIVAAALAARAAVPSPVVPRERLVSRAIIPASIITNIPKNDFCLPSILPILFTSNISLIQLQFPQPAGPALHTVISARQKRPRQAAA